MCAYSFLGPNSRGRRTALERVTRVVGQYARSACLAAPPRCEQLICILGVHIERGRCGLGPELARLEIVLQSFVMAPLELTVEFDREDDGRWIAAVPALSGVMVYGDSREDARRRVHALALHVLADRLEAGELHELPSLSLHDAA